ncbi:MAG: IS200/IS605 family transposase [Pyrinomonadaceae bacterium]|nr:IS200/IS605 family transposase [Pyrinomonadaceae bacterium]
MSHTRLLYHVVFATKNRFPLIAAEWEIELYKYLAGIVRNVGGSTIEINGMPEHVHMLILLPPGDLRVFMRELKSSSSRWSKQFQPKFAWQRRYGAFTVSPSAVDSVREYIRRQKEHHQDRTFEEEYIALLKRHGVEFDERYLWD